MVTNNPVLDLAIFKKLQKVKHIILGVTYASLVILTMNVIYG